ncbi:MAG TPA: hypothetical protein VHE53_00810 [Patescibacteria group bacterium]|nr:hypothetical protein [Patescibacteria group bacterium]
MIRLIKQGKYSLIETFDKTKILTLDEKDRFAWIEAEEIGDILVATKKKFNPRLTVSAGPYRLYEVKNEPDFVDLKHLELFIGEGNWQGYLLPTGLPDGRIRRRIQPTGEVITKSIN